MGTNRVSIIIVNYNTKDELSACIKSIIDSKSKIYYEIIVVDNEENKNFEANLKNNFPEVIYVPNKNLGFGQGNNLGAKYAKGEYFFFLNPDTKILNNTLDELFRFIKKRKNTGVISPLLLNKKEKPHFVQGSQFPTLTKVIFSLSFIHKLFPNNLIARKFFLQDWDGKSPRRVDVFPGTAFLIKKDVFEKIGGFDEKYFLFYEEADLAQKIKSIGLENYIVPKSRLVHLGGASTRTRNDIEEIYKNSQYYYFKKWYGLPSAIFTKLFTNLNKYHLITSLVLLLGLFLRAYKLNEHMRFIGDQGWFYLSARDMLLTGKIPLVGITSSHVWLHQGPYWTYIVAFIFYLFNFNPIIPGYFTALVGAITIFLIYKIFKEMFSKNMALIASFLYATSPLIVSSDRFAYHTTLISFFSLIFIYTVYKWVKGDNKYFIFSLILIGILYNFELATFSLGGLLIVFLAFGLFKRKRWTVDLLDSKTILFSFLGLAITMLPILVYDFKTGFLQTLGFLLWILYKMVRTFLNSSDTVLGNNTKILHFLLDRYRLLTFASSFLLSILFLFSSFVFFLYLLKKEKSVSLFVIAVSTVIILFGFIANKTESDAYLPVFFPIIIAISAIFWNFIIKKIKLTGLIFLVIFGFMNVYYFFNYNLSSKNAEFVKRKEAVEQILKLTEGKEYNLIGRGIGSQFESFTMNYEFLLWKKGNPPSKDKKPTTIYVQEDKGIVEIRKK